MAGSRLYAVGAATTATPGNAHGGRLKSVTVVAAAATATVSIKENGSGGTVIYSASVVANTTHQAIFDETVYSGQLHITTTGAGGAAYIELI